MMCATEVLSARRRQSFLRLCLRLNFECMKHFLPHYIIVAATRLSLLSLLCLLRNSCTNAVTVKIYEDALRGYTDNETHFGLHSI